MSVQGDHGAEIEAGRERWHDRYEAAQRAAPMLLDRLRHGGGRLAGADHDRASAWWRRQMRRQRVRRIGGSECRVKQRAQEGAGVVSPG